MAIAPDFLDPSRGAVTLIVLALVVTTIWLMIENWPDKPTGRR